MLIILNNILPVNTGKIGFKSFPWVLLLCCFYISSILNAHGETQEYSIPLGKILVTRTLQFLISKIPYFSEINLIVFFILCVGDAILLITLCLHKKYFEFEVI